MSVALRRALLSVVVAALAYLIGALVIESNAYDIYVQAILYLAAVIAGGCCWIGSRPK